MINTPLSPPSLMLHEEKDKEEIPIGAAKNIEEVLSKIDLFSGKMDEFLTKVEPLLLKIEQLDLKFSETRSEAESRPVNITIFKVDEKFFGVESEKVFKLFKVPTTFQKKYSNLQKIRLKGFEVRMINLEKILSIPEGEPKGETKILMVKDNGEYKGFMIDQVLNKLSALSDKGKEISECFSGIIHSTYQEQTIEIPILDLKKL
jgi:chemotaxis signal transduction protein